MLGYILIFIFGCFIGLIMGALVIVSAIITPSIEKDEAYYKCKVNPIQACSDTCCKACIGAGECRYACGGDPTKCGMSIQYPKVRKE